MRTHHERAEVLRGMRTPRRALRTLRARQVRVEVEAVPRARGRVQDGGEARRARVPVLQGRERACARRQPRPRTRAGTRAPPGAPSGVLATCTACAPGAASASASTAAAQAGSSEGTPQAAGDGGTAQMCSTSGGLAMAAGK
jgi:hypothetical protein